MQILTVPAFNDNYIWLLYNPEQHACAVVDPGQSPAVLERLESLNATLHYIILTHHHQDHIGGVADLLSHYPNCQVIAGAEMPLPFTVHTPKEGEPFALAELGIELTLLATPGHTLSHVIYYDGQHLFSGDTLFNCGCGRLFEGSAQQMVSSLDKIAKLPETTQIYAAHEYTLANLQFALTVEPTHKSLQQYHQQMTKQRQQGLPTIPFDLKSQLLFNPFMRCHEPSIQTAMEIHQQQRLSDRIEVFHALRTWKDRF
ncbi:hydroxyacylglutathione hydrolase [Celerinatantimonas sp. YJH-8]|uniref:hydroxyacylglutathione hydrolase n=1 Tax=Celerinatantimonas sp. YJH-8 TaxID=3228714 RepID=UPI0038BEAAED